jgi:CBS domain-containing protein
MARYGRDHDESGRGGYRGGDSGRWGRDMDYDREFSADSWGGPRFGGRGPEWEGEDLGGGGFGGGFGGGYGGARGSHGGYRSGGGGYDRDHGRGRSSGNGDVRASEIMTENPETVTPDASIADVARKMRDLDVGIIPVVEDQESRRLRGVITDRDITVRAVAEGKDLKSLKVSDCMTPHVESCNKNDSLETVLEVMQQEQVRRVPITDREGRLVGIIAQADVAVDYAGQRRERKRHVARTLARVSHPAEPDRGGRSGGGSRGRGED